jgi:hypothetical protein
MFFVLVSACVCTTGIGKSMLGYLLLYRWARAGTRVVLEKFGMRFGTLLCPEGAFELGRHDTVTELARDGTM